MKSKSTDNSWISFSDIMTGLMVIFMFIAIAYMLEVQKKQAERDQLFEEFQETKEELYNELDSVFQNDFVKWNVELEHDLSIKFTNPDVLFTSNEKVIRARFQKILNEFLPKYFDIILQDKYNNKISEIRIEGHTDTIPAPKYDSDPYIGNVILSQLRSAEVLKYFRNMDYYKQLSPEKEKKLQYWFTANGLSYGRTLDSNKQLTLESGEKPNNKFSRRVEFRIITNSETIVEKVLSEMSK